MTEINQLCRHLEADFGLYPVVASEIEFYCSSTTGDEFFDAFRKQCAGQGIRLYKIEKERGEGQWELALAPADAEKTARDTQWVKQFLSGAGADFSAKSSPEYPGSGLHIHVHLADAQGKNVFYKDDAIISDALKYSIGGLLAWLPESMPVFAPTAESYARFLQPCDHTPTTVSWGANNRTVAIRLPDSEKDNKRIEHRVAGADADPEKVIAIILAAMYDGIKNKTEPGPQIYGDASLPMYGLKKLPQSLEIANKKL